jgi:hypothetical protein
MSLAHALLKESSVITSAHVGDAFSQANSTYDARYAAAHPRSWLLPW